jgi:hypothetical protein
MENKIQSDLQPLILEAMRRKDENEPEEVPESVMEQMEQGEEEPADLLKKFKERIENQIGQQCGLEDLYQDEFWNSWVAQLSKAGELFHFGDFRLAYIDKGDTNDYILIPGQKTTVITVDPKCPRDKILRVISE